MKRFVRKVIVAWVLAGVAGCGTAKVELADTDHALAGKTSLPEAFLLRMKSAGQNLRQLEGTDAQGKPQKVKGVTIDVPQDKATETARRLRELAPPGWLAFVSDRNYGIGGEPDHVSVLRASGFDDVLKAMGTNGWNYDLSPEMVVARVQEWDRRYGLILDGAGSDWLEASFKRQPPDMLEFAKEVYKFCPDVVNQGTETVEALAAEMKRTHAVYLWWD